MSRQSNPEAGVALVVKILPHPTHFFWCAGESVDKKARGLGRVALKVKRLGGWDDF